MWVISKYRYSNNILTFIKKLICSVGQCKDKSVQRSNNSYKIIHKSVYLCCVVLDYIKNGVKYAKYGVYIQHESYSLCSYVATKRPKGYRSTKANYMLIYKNDLFWWNSV